MLVPSYAFVTKKNFTIYEETVLKCYRVGVGSAQKITEAHDLHTGGHYSLKCLWLIRWFINLQVKILKFAIDNKNASKSSILLAILDKRDKIFFKSLFQIPSVITPPHSSQCHERKPVQENVDDDILTK